MSKILKESVFFFMGTLIPAAISFISTPIFTRYFTPSEYGVNSLIDTSFGYLNTVIFGIISSLVWRYYNEYKSNGRLEYFYGLVSFLIRISILSTVIVISIIVVVSNFSRYTKLLIISKTFALLFNASNSIYSIILRLEAKAKTFNFIQIFNSVGNFVFIYILTSVFEMRNIAMYIASIITSFFVYIYLRIYFRNHKKTLLPFKEMLFELRPMLIYAVISLSSNFVQNLLDSSDRYMISFLQNVESNGIYHKLYGVSNQIMAIFCTVFMNLFSPYIYKSISDKKEKVFFKDLIPFYIGIFVPLILFYAVFSDTITSILLAEDYAKWYFVLPLIVLGYFFLNLSSFSELLIRFTNPKLVPFGFLGACIINVIVNFLLIPPLGILGAAIGTVISYFFVFIYFSVIAKTFNLSYFFKKNWRLNSMYIIPILECLLYQFVIKKYINTSSVFNVLIAIFMACSYYIPYFYYYFIINKNFTKLFEKKI